MFINLTNHSSLKWGEEQKKSAMQFGTLVDIQFPNIPPKASLEEVLELVDKYYQKIVTLTKGNKKEVFLKKRGTKRNVIHIQGEFTFTFNLVNKLKNAGYTCIVSTTERNVVEEGDKKTVFFKFVQFREY